MLISYTGLTPIPQSLVPRLGFSVLDLGLGSESFSCWQPWWTCHHHNLHSLLPLVCRLCLSFDFLGYCSTCWSAALHVMSFSCTPITDHKRGEGLVRLLSSIPDLLSVLLYQLLLWRSCLLFPWVSLPQDQQPLYFFFPLDPVLYEPFCFCHSYYIEDEASHLGLSPIFLVPLSALDPLIFFLNF